MMQFKTATLAMAIAFAYGQAAIAGEPDPTVLAANAGFYTALNKLFVGEVEPMKAVWSHADDISYMGPTGQFDAGWPAILKDWEGQAALKLGGKVGPSEMRVISTGDLAVVSCYEVGENTNAAGKVEQLKLRATNIFRKEGGAWKMVGHQTDKLPYLAK
ncbi:MAG TPA: nuclear transport factor 2 family protein [Reyranella sp.]|nr:nuclear transport factor 2 family protein [Reyranella sp.]